MSEEELKSCPFCGGEAKEQWYPDTCHPEAYILYGYQCKVCGSSSFPYFRTKEEAIKAWNIRPEPRQEVDYHACEHGSFDVDEAMLAILQKYTKMPEATFEDICRAIESHFSSPEPRQEVDWEKEFDALLNLFQKYDEEIWEEPKEACKKDIFRFIRFRFTNPAEVDTKIIDALELILPMAKGYASQHRVGSNQKYIEIAEQALGKARKGAEEGEA